MKKNNKKKVTRIEEAPMNKDEPALFEGPQMPEKKVPAEKRERLIQAEVSQDLFDAVYSEIRRRNLKIRQVMEFGLQCFLIRANRKEAERLGIKIIPAS